jgi:hypothetical protein
MTENLPLTPEKLRRRPGRRSRQEELARTLAELGVDPALVDPLRVLASVAGDAAAAPTARVAAAKALLRQREPAKPRKGRTAKKALVARAAARAGGAGSGWGDDLDVDDHRPQWAPMLDRPAELERQARRRLQKQARDRRHRRRLAEGVVMATVAIDPEVVAWLRRTQWLVGPREGRAEVADALSRLLQDAARRWGNKKRRVASAGAGPPAVRPAFLELVAQGLARADEIGDGTVARVCAEAQRRLWIPPDLTHTGSRRAG